MAEVILSLQQQLDDCKKDEFLTRENLEELHLEKNKLNDRLIKMMEENEQFSSVIAELKEQLKLTETISSMVEEPAHRSEITGKLEEDLIKRRSLQNELSKLSNEKQ